MFWTNQRQGKQSGCEFKWLYIQPGSFVPGSFTTWLVHLYIFDDSPPPHHQSALLSCKEKLYNWANMVTNHSHIMVKIKVNRFTIMCNTRKWLKITIYAI